jgi:glycosyltransferase involved in cell wall biosynthesis
VDEPVRFTHMLLSVIVPAFQEGPSIYKALHHLLGALDELRLDYEVIVVVDGHVDDTADEARRVGSRRVRVVEYPDNRGKGHALRHGFTFARGANVAFIDADMELHPSGVGRLLEIMDDSGLDAVVGSKVHPESNVYYPRFRRFQSQVFRLLVRAMFRLDVADTQTGLKAFRRELLDDVMPHVRSDGFAFDLELLALASDAGWRIGEGPVELDYQFETTTGVRAVLNVMRETAQIRGRRRALRRELPTWRSHARLEAIRRHPARRAQETNLVIDVSDARMLLSDLTAPD